MKKIIALLMMMVMVSSSVPGNIRTAVANEIPPQYQDEMSPHYQDDANQSGITEFQPISDQPAESVYDTYTPEQMESMASELVVSNGTYTSLSPEEKSILFLYNGLREDTMTECADAGYSIRDSVELALIMQRMEISLNEALLMAEEYGGIEEASAASLRFVELQLDYYAINGAYLPEIYDLVTQGYEPDGVISAFFVAGALDMSISDVIDEKSPLPFDEKIEMVSALAQAGSLEDNYDNTSGSGVDIGNNPTEEDDTEIGNPTEEEDAEISNPTDDDAEISNLTEDDDAEISNPAEEDNAGIGHPAEDDDTEISHPLESGDAKIGKSTLVGKTLEGSLFKADDAEIHDGISGEAAWMIAKYNVKADFLADYSNSEGIDDKEIFERIKRFRSVAGVSSSSKGSADSDAAPSSFGISAYAVTAPKLDISQLSKEREYPTAAYTYNGNTSELVNKVSGSLVYEDHIATIPGKKGLDLNLTLQYDSDRASNLNRANYEHTVYPEVAYFKINKTILNSWMNRAIQQAFPGGTSDWEAIEYTLQAYPKEANAYLQFTYTARERGINFDVTEDWYQTNVTYNFNEVDFYRIIGQSYYMVGNIGYNETYHNVLSNDKWGTNPLSFMGVGWALKSTSIYIDDHTGEKQLRFPDGSTYRYDKTLSNYSKLDKYKLSDVKLTDDTNATFPGSKYILSYADGKKEYFDINGNIVATTDRYLNTIKYTLSGSNLTITDSMNQVTTITLSGNRYTVTLPDSKVYYYDLTNSGTHKHLTKKTDPLGNEVSYSYDKTTAQVDYFPNDPKAAVEYSTPMTVTYHLLKKIQFPSGASTNYTYVSRTGKIGLKGVYGYFAVSARDDAIGATKYNRIQYSYTGDHTANSGSFSQTATKDNGLKTTYNFNKSSKEITMTSEQTFESTTLKSSTAYTYNANKLPTKITKEQRNGSNVLSSIQLFEYDDKGNVTDSWSTLQTGLRPPITEHCILMTRLIIC